jgi:hypothetical protein
LSGGDYWLRIFIGQVHTLASARDQFNSNVEFDILICAGVSIVGVKKFQIVLIIGGDGFLHRPQHRRLHRPVRKDVELASDGRDLGSGHDEG